MWTNFADQLCSEPWPMSDGPEIATLPVRSCVRPTHRWRATKAPVLLIKATRGLVGDVTEIPVSVRQPQACEKAEWTDWRMLALVACSAARSACSEQCQQHVDCTVTDATVTAQTQAAASQNCKPHVSQMTCRTLLQPQLPAAAKGHARLPRVFTSNFCSCQASVHVKPLSTSSLCPRQASVHVKLLLSLALEAN